MLPRFTTAMVLLTGLGVVGAVWDRVPAVLVEPSYWVIATGVVGLVTALLVFWRALLGALIAAPLWLVLVTVFALRVGAPTGVGGWVITGAVLFLVTLAMVPVNGPIGGGLAVTLWLTFTAFVLRAAADTIPLPVRWWQVLLAALVALLATVGYAMRSRSSSRGLLRRLGRAGRVSDGLASGRDVWRNASARVLRKKAAIVRPSLTEVPAWKRRFVPLTDLGARVARVGFIRVWSSAEDHTLTFAGPRVGKTALVMNYLLDAPGAVIATSTKTDILDITRHQRAKRGPVYVFDPDGLNSDGSTITFDPLWGCTDQDVVLDRAADLLSGVSAAGTADAEYWQELAKQALAALMHAAALGSYTMSDVQRWVAAPTDERAKSEVMYELRAARAISFEQVAAQFLGNNDRTQSSITTTIMPALSWLLVPAAAAAAGAGGVPFDIERLITENGTVYLLGSDDAKTSPLVTALTAHIARQAKALAVRTPGRRLDPALTMVLDEAALICKIPLDRWTGDFGSRGITCHIAAQSRAQLRDKFGDAATGALMTNVTTKVVMAGASDDNDLQFWSTLCGERLEQVATHDKTSGGRSVSDRRVAVFTPGQVAQLPLGQALIIGRGMPPAIGRVKMAWNRWDLRKERLARHRTVVALRRTASRVLGVLDERGGNALITQCRWIADTATAAAVRIDDTARAAFALVRDRVAAGLDWAEANDPGRALVARVRLNRATRKARAALAARENQQPVQPVQQERSEVERGQS